MKAYLLTCGLAAVLMGCSGVERGYTPPTQGPMASSQAAAPPATTAWNQYNRGGPSAYRPGDPLQPSLNGGPSAGAIASAPPPAGDPLRSAQRTPYSTGLTANATSSPVPQLIPDSLSKENWTNDPAPTGAIRRVAYEQPAQQPPLRGVSTPGFVPGAPQPLLTAGPETTVSESAASPLPPRSAPWTPAEASPRQLPQMPESVASMPRTEEKAPPALIPAKAEEKQLTPPALLPTKGGEEKTMPAGSQTFRMVNSKRIVLNYELKDVGPSGVSSVEMWYTRDGRTWQKDEAAHSGPPYTIEVPEEGMYGFTLVARNGVGLGKEPPKPGDLPQVWVEVDLSRPSVTLVDVKHGNGIKAREVSIQWEAHDRNLARRPVTLSYSTAVEGPWVPFAVNLENSGQHTWTIPQSGPFNFFVRIEAVDMVGNVGVAQSAKPLSIDPSQPTVSILGVESGEK